MAGIGEVLPLKFGDFLLDFILVLSNLTTAQVNRRFLLYKTDPELP